MAEKETLITVPTVDDEGRTIIVTANLDVARFRSKDRYNLRVEVTLPYTAAGELGFPDDATAEMLEKITESFEAHLKGKTTAVMTGIYTGGGERNWVFYTFSTQTFNGFLNRSLAEVPLLPLKIYAENDPDWAEYDEMLKAVEM